MHKLQTNRVRTTNLEILVLLQWKLSNTDQIIYPVKWGPLIQGEIKTDHTQPSVNKSLGK